MPPQDTPAPESRKRSSSQCSDNRKTPTRCDNSTVSPRPTKVSKLIDTREQEEQLAEPGKICEAASNTNVPAPEQQASLIQSSADRIRARHRRSSAEGSSETPYPVEGTRGQAQNQPSSNLTSGPVPTGRNVDKACNKNTESKKPRVIVAIGTHPGVLTPDKAVPLHQLSGMTLGDPREYSPHFSVFVKSLILRLLELEEVPECVRKGAKVNDLDDNHALDFGLYGLGMAIASMEVVPSLKTSATQGSDIYVPMAKVKTLKYLRESFSCHLQIVLRMIRLKLRGYQVTTRFTNQIKIFHKLLERLLNTSKRCEDDFLAKKASNAMAKIAKLGNLGPGSDEMVSGEECKSCVLTLFPENGSYLGSNKELFIGCYLSCNTDGMPLKLREIPGNGPALGRIQSGDFNYLFNHAVNV